MLRFTHDEYCTSHISTLGVDFLTRLIYIDGLKVKLQVSNLHAATPLLSTDNEIYYRKQLWDTAGQERFQAITTSYYRGTDAIILAYDVTDLESFQNIIRWIDQIHMVSPKYCVLKLLSS